MNRLLTLSLAVAAAAMTALAGSARSIDQATARPGARLEKLNAGQHSFGSAFDPKEHLGEIVVINIGGA